MRRQELSRLMDMGVRGVKVDFFGGDKQSVIRHYLGLLQDAAAYGLLVNVHGATLPRGWSRTYPNFMTAEAVRGYEFITFGQADADLAATHAATLPFTRNVVGPMDFTPTMLSDRVGSSTRRTSDVFDVAMTVVFESGLQHLGVTPATLDAAPEAIRAFLREVPATWDEIHFLEGFPGDWVVLARRTGDRWYIAGINAESGARAVEVDLGFAGPILSGFVLSDGTGAVGVRRETLAPGTPRFVTEMLPQGGFVAVIERRGR